MTPREALQVLDAACSQVQATREVHQTIARAVRCLADMIREGEETVDEAPPPGAMGDD